MIQLTLTLKLTTAQVAETSVAVNTSPIKPQQCYKLIKTLLQTENEGKLGFELWPRFADFARFFFAFALNTDTPSKKKIDPDPAFH